MIIHPKYSAKRKTQKFIDKIIKLYTCDVSVACISFMRFFLFSQDLGNVMDYDASLMFLCIAIVYQTQSTLGYLSNSMKVWFDLFFLSILAQIFNQSFV